MNNWEPIPFPTPLHIHLDCVYNIDKDLGILTITQWSGPDGVLSRLVRQAKLAEIQDPSLITIEAVLQNAEDFLEQQRTQHDQTQSAAALKIDIGTPTSLNELQFRLFTDFCFSMEILFWWRCILGARVPRSCLWETGGIYGEYRKKKSRSEYKVAINGLTKTLHLRLGKPENRWPELSLIRRVPVSRGTINYTIYFNGVFSGLAYGLDK